MKKVQNISPDDVLETIKDHLPQNRDDDIDLSYSLQKTLRLEIRGTRRNCYLLLQKMMGQRKERFGACGVAYRPDAQQGEIGVYAHRFHCPQDIHQSLRGSGLMTLMQSVRDTISGRLDHETGERSDSMTFYIKRGYLPTGYFDTSVSASWKSEESMHEMDSKTYQHVATFLRSHYKDNDVAYFPKLIRFGYSPHETDALYDYIAGRTNQLQDDYLQELREKRHTSQAIILR